MGSSSKHKDKKHPKERKHKKEKKHHKEKETTGKPPSQISEEDYFLRSREFRVWLLRDRKKAFEDLTTEKSHELFGKFVKKWNAGALDATLYDLPPAIAAAAHKTRHDWGFVNRLSGADKALLDRTKGGVDAITESAEAAAATGALPSSNSASTAGAAAPSSRPSVAPRPGTGTGMPPPASVSRYGGGINGDRVGGGAAANDEDQEERRLVAAAVRGGDRKRRRERDSVLLDEVAPRETGRQAAVDRRRTAGDRLHGAARDREDAADGLEAPRGVDVMGDSPDDFKRQLSRAQELRQRREGAATDRMQSAARQEEERRRAFLEQMGIKPGQGRIQIAPRNDK